ncbi:tRNA (adenosine(37)-N6)-threonylcarbamoyltransferase complex dimerization subunit type 1 TsaB [Martelella endophytica]|uniref:Gcp-like domain-containing protein n=1 Tax=Martelella endophytica TaxID=1486262 RepID=A0A0D5LUD6_MAREN|nr:tRNA (adenosine(37)-N6)-threonylcarbamoyltransferase complex dimerization subunit type 1 TsaB [Martelella endophytica]AJY47357.1 hypothetical protein TM49_19530 [Martelella endophytica]
MIILALDTASADCAVAIADGDVVLSRAVETIGKGHAERLMPLLDACLHEAGITLQDIDRIAVNIGPGSFTGIRVGVSAARALALAIGCECVGVSSLAVLGEQQLAAHPGRAVLVTIDARRGEAFSAVYASDGAILLEPAATAYEDLAALAARFDAVATGSGAIIAGLCEASTADHVEIETIARLGLTVTPGASVSPLYLRAADARPQAGFTLPRA